MGGREFYKLQSEILLAIEKSCAFSAAVTPHVSSTFCNTEMKREKNFPK